MLLVGFVCLQVQDDVDALLRSEGLKADDDDDRLRHLFSIYQSTKVYLPSAVVCSQLIFCCLVSKIVAVFVFLQILDSIDQECPMYGPWATIRPARRFCLTSEVSLFLIVLYWL